MAMPKAKSNDALEGEWECMECGYIEEGVSNRRPKRCPECNAPATAFEFFEYEDEDWDDLDDDWEDDDEYNDIDDLDDDDDF